MGYPLKAFKLDDTVWTQKLRTILCRTSKNCIWGIQHHFSRAGWSLKCRSFPRETHVYTLPDPNFTWCHLSPTEIVRRFGSPSDFSDILKWGNGAPWVAPLYSCTSWGATVGPSEMTGSKWAKAEGSKGLRCKLFPDLPRNWCSG